MDKERRKGHSFNQVRNFMLNAIAFLLITNIVVFMQCLAWKQKALENKVEQEVVTEVQFVTLEKHDDFTKMDANISFYCPCTKCCGKSDGITASGIKATPNHTIAMDSRFPFGTKVLIGDTVYTVEDRGGSIEGNKIDIFVSDHNEALKLGRKYMSVYILNGEE